MYREQCPILPGDTAGDVHDKLMELGAELVEQTVESIIEGSVEFRVQRSFIQGAEVLKPAPKITKEMCRIDWNHSTSEVYNLVRGLSPYPTAYTEIQKEGEAPVTLKVFFGEKLKGEKFSAVCPSGNAVPGQILSDGKSYFAIATTDGALSLTDLQIAGKKRMDAKTFLMGFRDIDKHKIVLG